MAKPMANVDSCELLRRYQEDESHAAREMFDRYVARLVALARQKLSAKLRRRIDAEDIVQSAYRSFFLHAENDEYVLKNVGDLWRLLAQITLHKLYGQIEKHTAARRNVAHEDSGGDAPQRNAAAPNPTPVEAIALVEQLRFVLDRLTPDQRTTFVEQLQGKSVDQIAATLQKSPRTVRRLLAEIQRTVEQQLVDRHDESSATTEFRISPALQRVASLRYEDHTIERILGAGAMGRVYRARERAGNVVAIKALRKLHQRNRRAIEQFIQEAEVLATLHHPNITVVHGLGRFPAGGLFIVMEFIDGTNLQERIRQHPLCLPHALAIVRDIADAVAHAHDHGIVHCDLKPGNILLDRTDRPVVTDFGFARITASPRTETWSIGGTKRYMAPEVLFQGKPPTAAADIYALGALLWALLTGMPPDTPAAIEPVDNATAACAVTCNKCLASDPRSRYHTAREFQTSVKEVLARIPTR
jgi:eukaryotic-like serine/threonine-protein kinase